MKKILYLGLDPQRYSHAGDLYHYPVIRIEPFCINAPAIQRALRFFEDYTIIIFTSQSTVKVILSFISQMGLSLSKLKQKKILAIGKATAASLIKAGVPVAGVAAEETAEGMIDLMAKHVLETSFVFYPRSALARPVIDEYLTESQILFCSCPVYEATPQTPLPIPELNRFDEIVFTSPSTVDAFIKIFGNIPWEKKITTIGPITRDYLKEISQPLSGVHLCKQRWRGI